MALTVGPAIELDDTAISANVAHPTAHPRLCCRERHVDHRFEAGGDHRLTEALMLTVGRQRPMELTAVTAHGKP
jgi:hypothetical protein